MEQSQDAAPGFTDDHIGGFVAFAETLERIHRRLEFEGFSFTGEAIYAPSNY